MIHIRARVGSAARENIALDELTSLSQETGALVWIDLESPSPEEISRVGEIFGWQHLTIEDLVNRRERVKLEHFDTYLYLVLHSLVFEGAPPRLSTPEVDFIIGNKYVATVHSAPLVQVASEEEIVYHAERMLREGPDYLLFELIDQLVDSYFPVLDAMNAAVDDLEERIVQNPSQALMPRIFDMKRDAVSLRRVISPQLEVFTRLTGPSAGIVTEKHAIYFRDVYDHLVRVFDEADSYRDLMSGALDAYLSTMSNQMSQVMQRLTVLAALFLPVTFITGLFGMNLRRTPIWSDPLFWLFLGGMVAISVAQFLYFRRKRWA